MRDKEIEREAARIITERASFPDTLERLQGLFQTTSTVASLTVHRENGFSIGRDENISTFLYSRQFPYRGIYTARFAGNVLVLCLGSVGVPGPGVQLLLEEVATLLTPAFSTQPEQVAEY